MLYLRARFWSLRDSCNPIPIHSWLSPSDIDPFHLLLPTWSRQTILSAYAANFGAPASAYSTSSARGSAGSTNSSGRSSLRPAPPAPRPSSSVPGSWSTASGSSLPVLVLLLEVRWSSSDIVPQALVSSALLGGVGLDLVGWFCLGSPVCLFLYSIQLRS